MATTVKQLAKRALALQKAIAAIQATTKEKLAPLTEELNEVLEELDPLFVLEYGEKGSLLTPQGKISRQVTNSYSYADNVITELRAHLSEEAIEKYVKVEEKLAFKPTAEARKAVVDGDLSHTIAGQVLRRVLVVDTSAKLKLEPVQ